MPDLSALLAAVQSHAWPVVAALVIGAIVRATKPDVTWLPNVPARFRPVLAVALGLVVGAADAIANGTPWRDALTTGAGAAVTAILGHVFVIDVARGGAEVPMPSGAKASARGCAVADAMSGAAVLGVASLALAAIFAFGCGPTSKANAVVPHETRIELECSLADAALRTRGVSDAEIAIAHAACVAVAAKYGAALHRGEASDAGADR